jgi:tetratricopeptide (TPR) repeat protein
MLAASGMDTTDWEIRLDVLWNSMGSLSEVDFHAAMTRLTAELPPDDPIVPFERASAYDSTGRSDLAVPLYRQALGSGLTGLRRRRAIIQLASSLRNLGHADESVALLEEEMKQGPDDLDDAVSAFLALALSSVGREREGLSLALVALAPHLKRYNRSLAAYGRELIEGAGTQ